AQSTGAGAGAEIAPAQHCEVADGAPASQRRAALHDMGAACLLAIDLESARAHPGRACVKIGAGEDQCPGADFRQVSTHCDNEAAESGRGIVEPNVEEGAAEIKL